MARVNLDSIRKAVLDVPDFPKPGIVFKDITPVLDQPDLFRWVTLQMAARWSGESLDYVVGIESRGFILGAALAGVMGLGFVPIRKPKKLPRKTLSETYALEYGTDTLEVHEDAFPNAARVVIVDDVLATGGTAKAAWNLCKKAGADVVGLAFLMELGFLDGRRKLEGVAVQSLLTY